ncbi:MAG: TRAP transporter substrate-binding protein [Candidatus Eremiobacteraeota bacterium]|nr:TRAP transporter substrate-binding protein [Candidatus Eremiobacteraeota bacterium]
MTTRAAFAAGAAATFAGIGIITPARAAQFDFKMGHDLPADHPLNVRSVEAAARILKATNGRVQVRLFPNSQLGGDPAMLTQLRSGALEILAFPGAFLTTVPVGAIENVAFAFPNSAAVFKAMDGKLGGVIRDAIKSTTSWVLDKIWQNGFRDLTTSTKPIRNVDDLAGFKIRVSPGKIRVDTFQSLGASPTAIAASELYTALQTKVVDGQENPLLTIETLRLYEVQKFCSLSHHMWSGYWTLINNDAWKRLSPDLQSIVARELNQAAVDERRDTDIQSGSVQDKLHRQGLSFNPVDVASFKKKLVANGYYTRWKNEFGEKAWATLEEYAGKFV